MARVTLEQVSKRFGDVTAVDDIDLEIEDGSFTILLGPSGCGKTTTLNLIAGLEEATSGRILFDGEEIQDRPPHRRDIAMVFQSYALYPNRSVRQNVAFGLRMRRVPKATVAELVDEVAEKLGISGLLDRRPRQLSGGQQQRVALARAIVRRPRVFLLDEPLSNLDAKLRSDMRIGLKELQRELNGTFVYVTHDQGEAMSMADRVVVMESGRIRQVDDPLTLYRRPADLFVATFIGSPTMNLIEGEVDGHRTFSAAGWTCQVPEGAPASHVVLGVRAEGFHLEVEPDGPGRVRVVEHLGVDSLIAVTMPFGDVVVRGTADPDVAPDDKVSMQVDPNQMHLFDRTTGERIPVEASVARSPHDDRVLT